MLICIVHRKPTLVARRDGVIRVAGELGTSDLVPPPRANPGASRNRDHVAVLVHKVGVAGKLGVVDVLDRVVAGRGSDAPELALVGAIDRELLKDGMGARGRGKRENLESLHRDQLDRLRLADG
jgi:hypothetical protein